MALRALVVSVCGLACGRPASVVVDASVEAGTDAMGDAVVDDTLDGALDGALDAPLDAAPDAPPDAPDLSTATRRLLVGVNNANLSPESVVAYLDGAGTVGTLTVTNVRAPCSPSPDKQRLVVKNTVAKEVSVASLAPPGSTTVISHPVPAGAHVSTEYTESWSPDSQRVLYVAGDVTEAEPLYLGVPGGTPLRISPSGIGIQRQAVWMAEGGWYAFASSGTPTGRGYIGSVGTTTLRALHDPLTPHARFFDLRASPTGTLLAYEQTCMPNEPCADWSGNDPTPAQATALWVVDAASSMPPQRLGPLPSEGEELNAFAWSRDGSHIAFAFENQLYVASVSAAPPWTSTLVATHAQTIEALAWSPDEQWLAYRAGNPGQPQELYVVRSDASAAPQLVSGTMDVRGAFFEISPTSQYLTFVKDNSVTNFVGTLYATRLDGATIITASALSGPDHDVQTILGGWSPDGSRYFYLSIDNSISNNPAHAFIVDMTGSMPGAPVAVAPQITINAMSFLWGADSSEIVLGASEPLLVKLTGTASSAPIAIDPQHRRSSCFAWL